MLGITERAGRVLKTILDKADAAEGQCIRLDISRHESRLALDRERPGDEVYSFRGRKVLAVDYYTAEECAYRMLDCKGCSFFFVSPIAGLAS